MDLAKRIIRPLADACFEYLRDEERMEAFWDWADQRANDTETTWDDVAVGALKAAAEPAIDIAEDFVYEWLDGPDE